MHDTAGTGRELPSQGGRLSLRVLTGILLVAVAALAVAVGLAASFALILVALSSAKADGDDEVQFGP